MHAKNKMQFCIFLRTEKVEEKSMLLKKSSWRLVKLNHNIIKRTYVQNFDYKNVSYENK